MNLIFRLLLVVLHASRRTRLGVIDESVLKMRVWPTDLDIQMHMNNGRYLSLMDLGRIDLLVRSGFARVARQRGWFPVVGTGLIDYRRSLTAFEGYELKTRLIGWDERWFFIEQQFVKGPKIAASATVKAMIRSKAGAVSTREALSAIGYDEQSPILPERIAGITTWSQSNSTPHA
jgi:acyl-CoA thioesterase FadM